MLVKALGLCVAVFLVIVFVYTRKCHRHWKSLGVPSTSPSTIFGDWLRFAVGGQNMAYVMEKVYRSQPNARWIGFYECLRPALLIKDPRIIGAMLAKDFSYFHDRTLHKLDSSPLGDTLFALNGRRWELVRAKLTATFSTSKLKLLMDDVGRCVDATDSQLRKASSKDAAVRINEVAKECALKVMAGVAFGWHVDDVDDVDCVSRRLNPLLAKQSSARRLVAVIRFFAPRLPALLRLPASSPKFRQFLVESLRNAEERRKGESNRRPDFVQMMLDMRDRERARPKANPVLDDNVILSHMCAFALTALEAPALTISLCLYELALHPEMQERLREEIQAVLAADDGVLTYEAVTKMAYMEMVLSETLRKYSVATAVSRVCTKTYQLAGTSVSLIPGMRIYIPIYSIHHDEKFYPNPEEFDPERFEPENSATRPAFTYLPFGLGPRACIGTKFVKMEMKLCLFRILSKYEMRPCAKTEVPIIMKPSSLSFLPKNDVWLQILKLDRIK